MWRSQGGSLLGSAVVERIGADKYNSENAGDEDSISCRFHYRMLPRRVSGLLLIALLASLQAGPLTAAMCSARSMDCCTGKMCPMTKNHRASQPAHDDCAMQDSQKSGCCCSLAPCKDDRAQAIHSPVYLVAPVLQFATSSPRAPLASSVGVIWLTAASDPEFPPPRTIPL